MPGFREPPDDMRATLVALCWDQGSIPFDLERDFPKAFVAAISCCNYMLLDELYAWLGRHEFTLWLSRHASEITQSGLRLAVLRFDLPIGLIDLGYMPDRFWLGPDTSDTDGLRLLQPVDTSIGSCRLGDVRQPGAEASS
jgi:hypothetical protein